MKQIDRDFANSVRDEKKPNRNRKMVTRLIKEGQSKRGLPNPQDVELAPWAMEEWHAKPERNSNKAAQTHERGGRSKLARILA